MFHIVLIEPEIPPNTGNVIRLAANSGCELHLVGRLGFELDDKRLRRAGLDYHEYARLHRHADFAGFLASVTPHRVYAFSSKAERRHDHVTWCPKDALVFGPETRGLSDDFLARFPAEQRLRLPMVPRSRSINLSNAVAIAVYEAWRQLGFAGAE
jgi:tRNA (cytidine/uridine-2'-O-)-methyltransferase